MTVVRSKSHGVQMHGDHMFWGTKIQGPPDSEVCEGHRSTSRRRTRLIAPSIVSPSSSLMRTRPPPPCSSHAPLPPRHAFLLGRQTDSFENKRIRHVRLLRGRSRPAANPQSNFVSACARYEVIFTFACPVFSWACICVCLFYLQPTVHAFRLNDVAIYVGFPGAVEVISSPVHNLGRYDVDVRIGEHTDPFIANVIWPYRVDVIMTDARQTKHVCHQCSVFSVQSSVDVSRNKPLARRHGTNRRRPILLPLTY